MEATGDYSPSQTSPHLNLICNLADATAVNLAHKDSPGVLRNQDLQNEVGTANKRAEIAKMMFDKQAASVRKEELQHLQDKYEGLLTREKMLTEQTLMRQSYFRQQQVQNQQQRAQRQRVVQNMESFNAQKTYGYADKIYRRGAQLLLNKVYKLPHEQRNKTRLNKQVQQQKLLPNAKQFGGAAGTGMAAVMTRRFASQSRRQLSHQGVRNSRDQRARSPQQRAGSPGGFSLSNYDQLNELSEIQAGSDVNFSNLNEAIALESNLSQSRGQRAVQIEVPTRPQSTQLSSKQIGTRPVTAGLRRSGADHGGQVTKRRLQSAAGLKKPVNVSNVFKSFDNLNPQKRFQKFMGNSELHQILLAKDGHGNSYTPQNDSVLESKKQLFSERPVDQLMLSDNGFSKGSDERSQDRRRNQSNQFDLKSIQQNIEIHSRVSSANTAGLARKRILAMAKHPLRQSSKQRVNRPSQRNLSKIYNQNAGHSSSPIRNSAGQNLRTRNRGLKQGKMPRVHLEFSSGQHSHEQERQPQAQDLTDVRLMQAKQDHHQSQFHDSTSYSRSNPVQSNHLPASTTPQSATSTFSNKKEGETSSLKNSMLQESSTPFGNTSMRLDDNSSMINERQSGSNPSFAHQIEELDPKAIVMGHGLIEQSQRNTDLQSPPGGGSQHISEQSKLIQGSQHQRGESENVATPTKNGKVDKSPAAENKSQDKQDKKSKKKKDAKDKKDKSEKREKEDSEIKFKSGDNEYVVNKHHLEEMQEVEYNRLIFSDPKKNRNAARQTNSRGKWQGGSVRGQSQNNRSRLAQQLVLSQRSQNIFMPSLPTSGQASRMSQNKGPNSDLDIADGQAQRSQQRIKASDSKRKHQQPAKPAVLQERIHKLNQNIQQLKGVQRQAQAFKSMLDRQGSKYPGGALAQWSSENLAQQSQQSKRMMRSQSNKYQISQGEISLLSTQRKRNNGHFVKKEKAEYEKSRVFKKGDDLFTRSRLNKCRTASGQAERDEIDAHFVGHIHDLKEQRLYEIQDVQNEIEEQSQNESDFAELDQRARDNALEVFHIKRKIRVEFKRKGHPPPTETDFYKVGKIIGRGAFGKVNIAMHKLTRKLVAVKSVARRLNKPNAALIYQRISHEKEIMAGLRHPNIVQFFEHHVAPQECIGTGTSAEPERLPTHDLYFMELCQGGDLLQYVRQRQRVPENIAKYIFRQIIIGIGYLHHKGIIHRDIKLENIFLDNEGHVKIGDFGVSTYCEKTDGKRKDKGGGKAGTVAYWAPELCGQDANKGATAHGDKSGRQSYESDIWAAGVVLYVMIYGMMPFTSNGNNEEQLKKEIARSEVVYNATASEECKALMKSILQKEPKGASGRATTRTILKDPWLQSGESEKLEIFNDYQKKIILREFIYQEAEIDKSQGRVDVNNKFSMLVKLTNDQVVNADGYTLKRKSETEAAEDGRLDINDFHRLTDKLCRSTGDAQMRNLSDKSSILGPFNTSLSARLSDGDFEHMFLNSKLFVDQHDELQRVFHYGEKVREFNQQYEANYNDSIDNGVIIQDKENIEENKTEKPVKQRNKDRRGTSVVNKDPGVQEDEEDDLLYDDDLQVAPKALRLAERLGYNVAWTEKELRARKNNHCTTTYHLVRKDQHVIA